MTYADTQTQTPVHSGIRAGLGDAPGMGVPGGGGGTPAAAGNEPAAGPGMNGHMMAPDRRLYTGVPRLDGFIGGFRPSEVVLLDSSHAFVFDLTSRICVEAVGAGGGLVFIDGGNSVDPHAISGICRARGLDKGEVLRRMSVARAFTAYQMDSLVNEGLEDMLRRTGAPVAVVSCMLDMFFDKDMEWPESFRLIRRCVNTLERLASELGVTVLVTNLGAGKIRSRRALFALMYGASSRVVRLEGASRGLRVSLPMTGRATLFSPVPPHQTILDRFFAVCEGGG